MAAGKPVIATSWSGNMDFMDVSNSFPVRYELVELQETVGPYRAGETWAEPSIEHAAESMRLVFEDRVKARIRAQNAKREIEANYSEEAVASLVQHRLEVIASRHQFPAFKREIRAFFSAYQQLVQRIREVVRAALPSKATVIVVSKGDKELVKLDDRQAWHFPQDEEGVYAGYHPASNAEAIAHLEELQAKGGEYLLFPGTAFWWLEHYKEFDQHLEARYQRVWDDEVCVIYELSNPRPVGGAEMR
jgi:hypothetical protein